MYVTKILGDMTSKEMMEATKKIRNVRLRLRIQAISLLSRYKSNNNNWLAESPVLFCRSCSTSACKMGIFSKTVTLKICNIV